MRNEESSGEDMNTLFNNLIKDNMDALEGKINTKIDTLASSIDEVDVRV